MKKAFLLIILLPLSLLAQQITVKGKVLDKDTKEPLVGVAVFVKGTKKGTNTNFDGDYELKVKKGAKLTFSYLGFKTKTIEALTTTVNVFLEEDAQQLEQITISVGYFDVSKKDLSGSIAQVKAKDLEKNRTQTMEQLLQGQVAGVVIGESAEPGGGISLAIRGTNSILGGTQPLYVVDGIPIDPLSDAQGNSGGGQSQNSLSFLNPNDIAKIEVLKDAAATAMYGARGANGVVLITTKTGSSQNGRDSFSFVADNFMTDVIKNIDVMNGPQFERYLNQRSLNQLYVTISDPSRAGVVFDGTQDLNDTNFPELATFTLPYPTTTGVDNNWQDLVYRMAYSNAYNMSYRGGNSDSNIAVSLGLQNTRGVITNTDNQRSTLSLNSQRKAFDKKIDIRTKTIMAYNKGNASSIGNGEVFQQRSVTSQTLQFQPIFSLLDPGQDDDIYADLNEGNIVSNPYTLATELVDLKTSFNFIQNVAITAKLTPKLTGVLRGAFNYQKSNRDTYFPTTTTRGRRNDGEATQSFIQNKKIYGEASLRYRNRFGKHRIDAILIGTLEKNEIRSTFNKAFGFGSDVTSFYNFSAATDVLVPITQFREVGLISGLFRVGYSYKNKYFVDVNTRMDASSKFAENNKSAIFPSIALAWALSQEDFLKDSETINNLKLRMSYGRTGSNPIAPYQSLALMTPIRYNFNNQIVTGFYESNLANDDLTWETTDQYNVGIDASFFNSKLNVTLDTYYKLTKDLLQNVTLPASNGFASVVDNFGEVENKGIELSVNANLYNTKDFSWNVNSNISVNRNKLVRLNSNLDFQLGPSVGFAQTNPIVFMEGMPLGIFWGAQTNGIYESWAEANASGIAGAAPGEIKYVNNHIDLDANGQPLATQEINFDDYVQIGDPNPDFNFAITNSFQYKNWDLTVLFTGQKGGDIFWVDSWALAGNQNSRNGLLSAFQDSWRGPLRYDTGTATVVYDPSVANTVGVGNPGPIVDGGPRALASDRQIFDGSYVRLKNINLGYTLNFQKNRSLRIYVTGQNLLTWTNYPGYDPEVQTFNKDPQRRGVDFGGYPGIRTYTFGLRLNY